MESPYWVRLRASFHPQQEEPLQSVKSRKKYHFTIRENQLYPFQSLSSKEKVLASFLHWGDRTFEMKDQLFEGKSESIKMLLYKLSLLKWKINSSKGKAQVWNYSYIGIDYLSHRFSSMGVHSVSKSASLHSIKASSMGSPFSLSLSCNTCTWKAVKYH